MFKKERKGHIIRKDPTCKAEEKEVHDTAMLEEKIKRRSRAPEELDGYLEIR